MFGDITPLKAIAGKQTLIDGIGFSKSFSATSTEKLLS